MQKLIKKSAQLLFFLSISWVILRYPRQALSYALVGLNTWFQNMIPTLFPFMVLSGMMIRLRLSGHFAKCFRPLLYPLYRLNDRCLYGIVVGFFCGFPMGAGTAAQLYSEKQIAKDEAELLLAFCNNIGPVFFTGFVLPFLPSKIPVRFYLLGMYGIPLLYGLFLRRLYYGARIAYGRLPAPAPQKPPSFAKALDLSVAAGLQSITKLGGYMVFFNLLNVLPQYLLGLLPPAFLPLRVPLCLLLEITGGIAAAGKAHPLLILSMLQFGGCSCIAQTYAMIAETDLPILTYLLHKLCQSALAAIYYRILFALCL